MSVWENMECTKCKKCWMEKGVIRCNLKEEQKGHGFMRLIEITQVYPYTKYGEAFCEHELQVATKYFDEILLVSLSGDITEKHRYIPQNAKLINARSKQYEIFILLKSLFQLLEVRTFQEFFFAKSRLHVRECAMDILKKILVYYYYENLLKRVLKKESICDDDILYSYWMAAPAMFLAGLPVKNLKICRTHGYDCFVDRGYQPFRREILKNLDVIISISEEGKNDIITKLFPFVEGQTDADKIRVSRLGIIRECIKPDLEGRQSASFTVCTCSSIVAVKRLDLLILALEKIDIPITWIHIGDGDLGDQVREQAMVLNQNGNVRYVFKGTLTQNQVYEFYEKNRVDLFINCSDSEGIPVSIMEAISFGIPVVARNVGGNREIVGNDNGILLDEYIGPSELREAICRIAEMSDEEYIAMRKNSVKKYEECFMALKNYRHFFEMIQSMAKEKDSAV